ncbi:tRNA-uridine aminocarboxypropyltransferase [Pseudomonas multiresinivorans]|uniref:tRNA-uridine aminocarboxypropyltransferase n=1 Tax=Pseudomonas multiresinivorans TaxID=95301 RepID=A0A7Z3GS90_9PSED|nr:DTW domain-containing protein [Pseudomonas multiresinivorans]QJP10846.1 DTW domain-containing protein [Pseudomonas multiresinivorans]
MSRARCPRCERPLNHCLCALIPRVDNRTRVLLLQHPSEVGHALNTARLAALGLANAELMVGDDFSGLDLSTWDAWLLFPGESALVLSDLAARPVDKPRLLVVPDGTWRKARKLLHLNPNLAALPRVVLPEGLTSRYRLRKAPAEGALSTIEAVVHALDALDAPQSHADLLRPFDALIEGQIAAMGEETFLRNHGPRSS